VANCNGPALRMLRRAAKGAGACCVVAVLPAAYLLHGADEGTTRALSMYAAFGPVVVHYRLVEARQKWSGLSREAASAEWQAMDSRYAVATVKRLGEMQGMYVKYGQTAAGFTDTFSKTWIAEFRKLEDQVPARSSAVVFRTIEEETGRPWTELFSEFDETPLGAASIGQVHRARLRSNGAEVAVKVQYPEVRQLFRTDMAAIRSFLGFASPKHLFTIGQLEKQLGPECDYLQEARNLDEVADNMTKHGFMPREVVVPRPVGGISTSRMLVMELLPGLKLSEGATTILPACTPAWLPELTTCLP
jgi:predicted unusual protein kinase regulating ubiquinone biosynthesis (AarF/ABC1/UbiB family)